MQAFQIIPKEVEKAFGVDGAEKFVLFLNQGFENQKANIIQAVSDAFHDHVTTEISRVRLEVADLRTDMAELRAELRTDMAELRAELRTDMAELRAELKTDMAELRTDMVELRTELKTDNASLRAEFKADISEVHKAISNQTRWILVALLAGAVLYPISIKLIDRLIPASQPSVILQPAQPQR